VYPGSRARPNNASAVGNPRGERSRFSPHHWVAIAGVAVALLLPLIARAVKVVSSEAALRRGLSELDPGDRSVTVSIVDSTGGGHYGALGAEVDAALRDVGERAPIHQVIFREASDTKGGGFTFGGADGLPRLVSLTEGRLPGNCQPERCEVIQLGDWSSTTFDPDTAQSAFGLVVVGRAERTDDLLLSGTFESPPGSPLLVGDGTDAVVSLAALGTHGRTFGWVIPVSPVSVVDLGADAWLERAERLTDRLDQVNPYFVLTLPTDAVRDQASRAETPTSRFGFAGLALPVAVLGSVILGATGLRRALLGGLLAVVLVVVSIVAICGVLAARSPLGFGRVIQSARGALLTPGLVLASSCVALLVAAFVGYKPSSA
jgi:hypothetical protein